MFQCSLYLSPPFVVVYGVAPFRLCVLLLLPLPLTADDEPTKDGTGQKRERREREGEREEERENTAIWKRERITPKGKGYVGGGKQGRKRGIERIGLLIFIRRKGCKNRIIAEKLELLCLVPSRISSLLLRQHFPPPKFPLCSLRHLFLPALSSCSFSSVRCREGGSIKGEIPIQSPVTPSTVKGGKYARITHVGP